MSGQLAETFELRCDKLYKQRIYELKKYVLEMFLNLEKNEVLKQLTGSPALEQMRISKIQQIVKQALEGEKERHIQFLVEKNISLATQLQTRQQKQVFESSKKIQDDLENMKSECEDIMRRMKEQHQRELDYLENQFKELLRKTLSNYESYLIEKMQSDSRSQCSTMEKLHQMNITQIQQHFQQKLREKEQQLSNLKRVLRQFEQDSRLIKEQQQQHLKKVTESLQSENRAHIKTILQLQSVIKSQQIQIKELADLIQQYSQHESDLTNLKKALPQLTFRSELQMFKLKEQFQTEIFKQRKNYEQELMNLKRQIAEVKAQSRNQISQIKTVMKPNSREQSTIQSTPSTIMKIGRIGSNKSRFKTMQDEFLSGLSEMKNAMKRTPSIRKVSFLQNI